jgi:hypothetical protein
MNKLLIVLFAVLLPFASSADTNAKRETVEHLMVIMKVDDMMNSIYSQMDQMFQGMAKELGVKESEQHLFDKYMSDMAKAMKEEITWEKFKEPMIDIYLKHYSEREINDMLAFYKSESGQSTIDKMPVVMEESMSISQKMFIDFLPKLKGLSTEFHAELQQARTKAETE